MAFWTDPEANEPTRQYRFLIISEDDEPTWYWAKSVTKPSFEVSATEHQLVNHKFKYPGVVMWNDITITIVDTGKKTKGLMDKLRASGYVYPDQFESEDGISKGANNYLDFLTIYQLNAEGEPIEVWNLKGAFVKSINFGDLDYDSDNLVTIQIGISYDWAEITEPQ